MNREALEAEFESRRPWAEAIGRTRYRMLSRLLPRDALPPEELCIQDAVVGLWRGLAMGNTGAEKEEDIRSKIGGEFTKTKHKHDGKRKKWDLPRDKREQISEETGLKKAERQMHAREALPLILTAEQKAQLFGDDSLVDEDIRAVAEEAIRLGDVGLLEEETST